MGANKECGVSRSAFLRAKDVAKEEEELLRWALALVERNMRTLYETAGDGWRWDSARTERSLRHPSTRLIVCWADEDDAAPIAFAALRFEAAGVYVLELHVDSRARGRGVGSHLLALVSAVARQSGAERLRLTCFAHNKRALRFYENRGFVADPQSPTAEEGAPHVILQRSVE